MDPAARFEEFADWCVDTSPLYERLARAVAGDPDLLSVAADVPRGKSPPHLLLGGVHFLLLRGADDPLAAYYPTVTDDPRTPDRELAPRFRAFVRARADDLREIFRARRTQTNAVGRCAALLPGFEAVSRAAGRKPLALIEVGPSAGLNLAWDRYRYDYGDAGTVGPDDAGATVESAVRGGAPPLPGDGFPPVASRVGVDLHPLDVTDPGDVTWLRALVWPEHAERHRLLRDAVAVAREDPPELASGDALELLPSLVERVPPDVPVCVFDTQVLYQFDDDDRDRFRALLTDLGSGRELHWLSGDEGVPDEEAIYLDRAVVAGGELDRARLGKYQQHGRWVEWLAE